MRIIKEKDMIKNKKTVLVFLGSRISGVKQISLKPLILKGKTGIFNVEF